MSRLPEYEKNEFPKTEEKKYEGFGKYETFSIPQRLDMGEREPFERVVVEQSTERVERKEKAKKGLFSKDPPKDQTQKEQSQNQEGKPSDVVKDDSEENTIDYRNLKHGDYELHVYLEETRALVHPTDSSNTVDPMIRIKALDQTKTTKYKSNRGTGMIYWGEHIFLNKKIDDGQEFQLEKMLVQVYDYNMVGSNALIGQFELDLASIFFSKDHSILHKWVALSNYDNKMEEIKGFIKFSANCVGPEDKQIELDDEKPDPKSEKFVKSSKANPMAPNVLLPPQIQTKGWQMKIQLIKAEHLIKMDFGGSIDCFLVFQFGSAQFITEVIKGTCNPVWGKSILIPYSEPTVNEYLVIKVFDYDSMSSDEILGSTSFRKKDIADGKKKNFFWLNIYGAQPDGDEKNSNIMNSNPELGSFWKGRILLSLSSVSEDNPKLDSIPLAPKVLEQFKKSDNMEWLLNAEVFFGLSFPNVGDKYSIQVRWADVELNFDRIKTNNGVWEWYSRKSVKCDFPYLSFDELPDVIVYVCSGDTRISYIRQSAKKFQLLDSKPTLYYFKPDRSKSPKLRDDQAGIVKMRISICLRQAFNDSTWSKPIAQPVQRNGFLFAYIYHAQELLPADSDGTSDPYFKLNYCGSEIKSEVVEDTLNPIWNQTYQLQVPLMKPEDSPPIILRMYDEDVTSDEFIGSVYINIEDAMKDGSLIYNRQEQPKPKWFSFKYNKNAKSGRILASFVIYESKPMNYNPKISLEYEKYYVKMKILGLRGLKSLGVFSVKKAFIKFDLNSLRSKENKLDLQEKKTITTLPNSPGSDPNICTIISFELNLPKDTTLWPHMNCVVHDSILKGLIQPVLGSFSINLAEISMKTSLKMEKKLKKFTDAFTKNQVVGKAFASFFQTPIKNENPTGQKESKGFFDLEIGKSATSQKYQVLTEERNVEKSEIQQITQKEEEKLFGPDGKINSDLIVKKAKYMMNQRNKQYNEVDLPDAEHYFPLGYDPIDKRSNHNNIKKHYRYIVDTPLEESPFMDKYNFDEFEILRGSRVHEHSVFMELIGLDETEKKVGKFKGWIDVFSETMKNKLDNNKASILAKAYFEKQNLGEESKDKKKINIDKEFIEKSQVIVRVYIISATSLPAMDDDSLSDPYIEVKLGKESKNNKKDYLKDVANANFYTMFELRTTLPGSSQLEINVWDYDELVRDDLIGQTTIDLENRYFSKKWRKLKYIPIETRDLYSPLSSVGRGRIKLWVEIIPVREIAMVKQIWEIKPKPEIEYELRVIVWECSGVPASDIEDVSDLYVTGRVGDTLQRTDIHYRSQDGNGSFNWRMVYRVKLPLKDPTITFQIYDKDILSADDFISETTLNFQNLAKEAFENDATIRLRQEESMVTKMRKTVSDAVSFDVGAKQANSEENKQDQTKEIKKEKGVGSGEKVEIMLQNAKKEGYSAMKDIGKLTISLELIPFEKAKQNPVGLGRSEPNHTPWLPPPAGRLEWSWNPMTLLKNLVGPAVRVKIMLCLCFTICCMLILFMFPTIFGSFIAKWL